MSKMDSTKQHQFVDELQTKLLTDFSLSLLIRLSTPIPKLDPYEVLSQQ